jgi:hypothetical protein
MHPAASRGNGKPRSHQPTRTSGAQSIQEPWGRTQADGEAADKANLLKQEEIKLQGDKDNKKKDCIKDMHPSISNMILMASAVDNEIQGEYTESFKAFYNS